MKFINLYYFVTFLLIKYFKTIQEKLLRLWFGILYLTLTLTTIIMYLVETLRNKLGCDPNFPLVSYKNVQKVFFLNKSILVLKEISRAFKSWLFFVKKLIQFCKNLVSC